MPLPDGHISPSASVSPHVLVWTATPPVLEGFYWVRRVVPVTLDDCMEEVTIVKVYRDSDNDLNVTEFDDGYSLPEDWTHWLGPLPVEQSPVPAAETAITMAAMTAALKLKQERLRARVGRFKYSYRNEGV